MISVQCKGGREILTKSLVTDLYYPAGTYTFVVPDHVYEVDVFLVGGGSGGCNGAGGGGGYTKTFKADNIGVKHGNAIPVRPGESIEIIVGAGGEGQNSLAGNGGYSQFKNENYRADGGFIYKPNGLGYMGGDGGSAGAADLPNIGIYAGSDGSDGYNPNGYAKGDWKYADGARNGKGQGYTTRDFGDPNGPINAGGGSSGRSLQTGGLSNYSEGSGESKIGRGGGGYGGGGGGTANSSTGGKGGDGKVMVRYWKIE